MQAASFDPPATVDLFPKSLSPNFRSRQLVCRRYFVPYFSSNPSLNRRHKLLLSSNNLSSPFWSIFSSPPLLNCRPIIVIFVALFIAILSII
uniref:Uncharacterized protein n=1 Tax=Romanomermis culicivorax TaxID=13658 RepID=A0A915I5T6_ROMCU